MKESSSTWIVVKRLRLCDILHLRSYCIKLCNNWIFQHISFIFHSWSISKAQQYNGIKWPYYLYLYLHRTLCDIIFIVTYSLNQWIHEAMFALCKSWMMEKSYNYKYPSVLECAQAVTMPCAKYFDKQTHSCAECNYVIFVLKKSEVKVVRYY